MAGIATAHTPTIFPTKSTVTVCDVYFPCMCARQEGTCN